MKFKMKVYSINYQVDGNCVDRDTELGPVNQESDFLVSGRIHLIHRYITTDSEPDSLSIGQVIDLEVK